MSPNLGTARMTGLAALAVAVLYGVSIPIGSLGSTLAADATPAAVAGFFTAHCCS